MWIKYKWQCTLTMVWIRIAKVIIHWVMSILSSLEI